MDELAARAPALRRFDRPARLPAPPSAPRRRPRARALPGRLPGEFRGLDELETRRAVDAGWRVLKLAGIEPDGFVAPAYAYTPQLRRVLPRRFRWWAGMLRLHQTMLAPGERPADRLAPAWGTTADGHRGARLLAPHAAPHRRDARARARAAARPAPRRALPPAPDARARVGPSAQRGRAPRSPTSSCCSRARLRGTPALAGPAPV